MGKGAKAGGKDVSETFCFPFTTIEKKTSEKECILFSRHAERDISLYNDLQYSYLDSSDITHQTISAERDLM